jgi:hypothetical protein
MRTRLTLHPGDRGAKQLHEQYGEQLVCVRYRHDEQRQKRYKTVELIVKEYDWKPDEKRNPSDRTVQIRVAASEREVRLQVKQAGGIWNPQLQVWELRQDQVSALGLASRIVGGKSL